MDVETRLGNVGHFSTVRQAVQGVPPHSCFAQSFPAALSANLTSRVGDTPLCTFSSHSFLHLEKLSLLGMKSLAAEDLVPRTLGSLFPSCWPQDSPPAPPLSPSASFHENGTGLCPQVPLQLQRGSPSGKSGVLPALVQLWLCLARFRES